MASSPRNLLALSSFYASLCVQISTFYKDTSHIRLTARLTAVAQFVKNLPAMQEIQVQSPGGEDPLEKKMVTHSSILAWKIPWTEEPGGP